MKFRKIAVGLSVIAVTNIGAPTIKVFANEVNNNSLKVTRQQEHISSMKKFDLESKENFEEYKKSFKISNELTERVSVNGGQYSSSSPQKAIDDNPSTHWETGKPNSETFTNEFTVEFKELVSIDKMTYKVRQDSGTKGFLNQYEIYGSLTDTEDDFTLITKGSGNSTRDTVQIKFDKTEVKRIKIKFVNAESGWASMSEVGFYKEDIVLDAMNSLFTDENKNKINETYNDINKLNELEDLAKNHVFYKEYKESIEDAKIIIQNNQITSKEAKTKIFTDYTSEGYNELFKMDSSNIEYIKNNAGHYGSQNIEKAIDGDINTYWETNKGNSDTWNNEIEIKFKERVVLDRLVYGARQSDTKGFLEEFEIYASSTNDGDTYQLVSTGKHNRVSGLIEAKFEPTEFKRIKLVYKKSNQNWATANEIWFYKEDEISNKIDRLFTDNTYSTVSEEFNSIEKIEALENEVKQHPLYNKFVEDIENAKKLILKDQIEASSAQVTKFTLENNEEYNQLFKMNNSNIKSIKSNSGHYGSQNIEKAIDGDLNTYWETNKSNTSTFSNEVEIEFKEDVVLNRIVYGARPTDAKGFAEEFDIYASTTTKGDTYELVSTGKQNRTKDLIEAKFEPTKFRRIKFVFKKSNQNWATAREFMFYTEDKLTDQINDIFTDGTYSDLKDDYKDISKINELKEQANNHPLKKELIEKLTIAEEILSENVDYSKTTIVANQHGDMSKHGRQVLSTNSFGQNLQATGLYVLPGDKITVYVEVDKNTSNMPVLQFSQNEGSWRGWRKGITLHPGKNEIIVPTIDISENHPTNPKAGGAIYIENPYTSEEQGKAPIIRVEGAERFPFFKEGDNEEEFKQFLVEYKQKLDIDNQNNTNKVLDIVDIESDRMLLSGTTTGAYDAYITKNVKPSETTTFWDESMEEIFRYYGLDGSSEEHDPKYIKEHIRLMQPYGFMYAWVDHVGVQEGVMSTMLNPEAVKASSWGFIHETGHRMDTANRIWGEVTNNMLSMQMGHIYGSHGNNVDYKEIYKKAAPDVREDLYDNGRYFESLGMFWQLQLYNDSYWANVNKLYRERKPSIANEQEKMDTFIEYSSEVYNKDLSEYFYKHGFRASEETKQKLADKFEKLDQKVWYINDTAFNYEGSGINKESKPTIEELKKDGTLTITSDINKDDLLGYEIIKNGEIIGFTSTNKFVDETKDSNIENKYQVIAYGKDLSTSSISEEVSNLRASIVLQQDKITLGLRDEFNPLEYVNALNYNGEDISSNIEVNHNVDTTKKGKYEVTYSVTDQNIKVEKRVEVEIVSAIEYLSDKEWESVETQYGIPRKNTNISGRVNGNIKQFEKGIGIHANGKIVYDLENTNYDNFEALVGVDMSIEAQTRSSINFKVLGDGKELANTKVLKHADDMVYINVPIKGIKNLTIEVSDGKNGNSSDHGIIANPILTTNNKKPELKIEESISTKVGQPIENIIGEVSAFDAEDGDLTNSITVTGHENIDFNKPGKYKLTYTVADSDNNVVSKERYVSIIDMRDFKYLTEYDWKSAVQSYSTTRKDKSVSNKAIRLTNENNQEVVYERGIGAHANATIIYDLSDKDYELFTSYVGVDREMYNRPGSVSFEVYVDGEKKFDSGLMMATDPAKFVEVNIDGAKELKLVVKDGGNGIGSDHASFGDTKLHFINEERANVTSLEEAIKKAEAIETDIYTQESIDNLNVAINQGKELLELDLVTQAQCDEAVKNIEEAINNLESLNQVIVIEDDILRTAIKDTLKIGDREITLADMYSLKSLDCTFESISSLKGLEYAKNLESLNIDYNEVSDISPIKDLDKLTNFSGVENYILNSSDKITFEDGKFIVEDVVIDSDGERLLPKEVVLSPNNNPVKLDLNEVLVGNKVVIDSSLIEGVRSIEILYESKYNNYQLYTMSLLSQK